MSRKRILVISRTRAGYKMSAPGIRALNMARTLAEHVADADVTLAIPNDDGPPETEAFRIVRYDRWSLPRLIHDADIIVSQYITSYLIPFVLKKRLVLDFFANYMAEWLELWSAGEDKRGRHAMLDTDRRYLNLQLSQADLVLAANERQRDLWLGLLAAIGRITPAVYEADPSLRSLVDVASFGVRPEPAVPRKRMLKGVYPGIGPDDIVMIWNGGIVNWYDPQTLLRAFARVSQRRPELKLFFLGTKYPIPDKIEGESVAEMIALSDSLGLTGKSVFFNEGWVPYEDSGDFLLDADIGVSTYLTNLETHFAQRVRLIDLIWAEKPIICNQEDTVAETIGERGMGITVVQQDIDALEAAIEKMLDPKFRERCRKAIVAAKPEFSWENCLRPVIAFCNRLPEPSPSRSYVVTTLTAASYGWSRLVQTGAKGAIETSKLIEKLRAGSSRPS